jgi:hypothetical protein
MLDHDICSVPDSPERGPRQDPTGPTASHALGVSQPCLVAEPRLRGMTCEIGCPLLGHDVSQVCIHEAIPVICGWCEPAYRRDPQSSSADSAPTATQPRVGSSHTPTSDSQALAVRTEATR